MARMKFFVDTNRCISCFGCQVACSSAHELPVGLYRRKVITLDDGVEARKYRLRQPANTAPTLLASRCVRQIAFISGPTVSCFTIKTNVSAADTASTHVRSVRRSFLGTGRLASKALWINAPCVLEVRRRRTLTRSFICTAKTVSRKAKSLCAPPFALQMRYLSATPQRYQTYIASALC